jgi:membrane protease YdiL (CAAX protease family)
MLLFGVVPVLVIVLLLESPLSDYGLAAINLKESLIWAGALSLIIILFNFFNSRSHDNIKSYPQIRKKSWSFSLFFLSAVSWIVYLFSYEFLFRGFLLFSCERTFGIWLAITINVAFYAAAHIPKGMKETLAAIPFGIILCWLTLRTQTIWVAFISHAVLALSNEWFSILAHPEMKFGLNKWTER